MNADQLLKISLVLELDAQLRQEVLVDLDQRASIGHDLKANVISWSKLPRKVELISPDLTAPHVILPAGYPIHLHDGVEDTRPIELTHDAAGPPPTLPLELGKKVVIDLPGARLHVELIDLGQDFHLNVPRAERRVQPPSLDRRTLSGLAALLLVSLGTGYFYTPQQIPFSAPLSTPDATTIAQNDSFEEFIAAVQNDGGDEGVLPVDTQQFIEEASAPDRLPTPLAKAQPSLGAELDELLRDNPSEALDSALAASAARRQRVDVMNTQHHSSARAATAGIGALDGARRDHSLAMPATSAARVHKVAPEPFNPIGVDETLRRNHHLFRACYDSSLRSSAQERRGRLDISFDITASGSVASASNFRRNTNEVGDELARCIERVLTRIDFPTEDTPGTGNISLVFASDD